MVHKVIGWLAGYVTIRLRDGEIERFVNMCRYKEIPLWNVYWDTKRKDRKSTRLNSSHANEYRMPSSA